MRSSSEITVVSVAHRSARVLLAGVPPRSADDLTLTRITQVGQNLTNGVPPREGVRHAHGPCPVAGGVGAWLPRKGSRGMDPA